MNVLVIEDDPTHASLIERTLSDVAPVAEIRKCTTSAEAFQIVAAGGIDLLVFDVKPPGERGLDLVDRLRSCDLDVPVIFVTASPPDEARAASHASRAVDCIVKRGDYLAAVKLAVARVERPPERSDSPADGRRLVRLGPPGRELLWMGRDPNASKFLERVRRAAQTRASVLVTGETGTGKELVAHMLHFLGSRASGPFVAENCAALPETLLESELFGYRKGAFTGALQDHAGLIEAANGGTLFLDEVADMSASTQAKVLRVVENGEFRRLGETRVRPIDVRFVAATNVDLRERIRVGTFRRDLFYRLSVIPIYIPPLRERPEDILDLAHYFLARSSNGVGTARITVAAIRRLLAHQWPGNVRELRNVVEAAYVLGDGHTLDEGPIAELLSEGAGADAREPYVDIAALRGEIDRLSKARVVAALQESRGNKALAARLCGCSRSTLYYALRKYNLPSGLDVLTADCADGRTFEGPGAARNPTSSDAN